jgi:hypothetical protein
MEYRRGRITQEYADGVDQQNFGDPLEIVLLSGFISRD